MLTLTRPQRTVLDLLLTDTTRGFDRAEIERRTGLTAGQVTRAARCLFRLHLAVEFVGGALTGPARPHWQAFPRQGEDPSHAALAAKVGRPC